MAFSISEKIVKESKNMRLSNSVFTSQKLRFKQKISTFFYFENTKHNLLGFLLHENNNQNLGFKGIKISLCQNWKYTSDHI